MWTKRHSASAHYATLVEDRVTALPSWDCEGDAPQGSSVFRAKPRVAWSVDTVTRANRQEELGGGSHAHIMFNRRGVALSIFVAFPARRILQHPAAK